MRKRVRRKDVREANRENAEVRGKREKRQRCRERGRERGWKERERGREVRFF